MGWRISTLYRCWAPNEVGHRGPGVRLFAPCSRGVAPYGVVVAAESVVYPND
jgi:hypothetical protein